MLAIVTWKWRNSGGWKQYTAEYVNVMRAMLERHLPAPHRLICFTDDAHGIDRRVEVLPLARWAAPVPTDQVMPLRNCFRKLGLFRPEMAQFGERLLQLDLDQVIVGDLMPLVERSEPMIIWRSSSKGRFGFALNTSVVLLDAGARTDIWDAWCADPGTAARAARTSGWTGTDQAFVAMHCNGSAAEFAEGDGILSFRDDLAAGYRGLPPSARIISFFDRFAPDDQALQRRLPWIGQYWRETA